MSSEDRPVSTTVVSNPWAELRRHTAARIALGRAGTSLPTAPHLEFQFAHAKARNAVQRELDVEALARGIADLGQETFLLASRAGDRVTYLQRPDAGRSLDEASRAAQKLVYLMLEAFRRNLSGVLLKDEEDAPAGLPAPGSRNFLTAGD